MPVTIMVPQIQTASFSKNPTSINTKITASVTIKEVSQTLYERYQYCGVARTGGRV